MGIFNGPWCTPARRRLVLIFSILLLPNILIQTAFGMLIFVFVSSGYSEVYIRVAYLVTMNLRCCYLPDTQYFTCQCCKGQKVHYTFSSNTHYARVRDIPLRIQSISSKCTPSMVISYIVCLICCHSKSGACTSGEYIVSGASCIVQCASKSRLATRKADGTFKLETSASGASLLYKCSSNGLQAPTSICVPPGV